MGAFPSPTTHAVGRALTKSGTALNYTEEHDICRNHEHAMIGASFKINNPIAAASCGCGTSFSI